MLDTVVYTTQAKNRALFEALVKGFPGRQSALEAPLQRSARRHVVAGLQFGALELLQGIWARRESYVFVDRAYFGGGPGSGRYRLTRNAYQQHWVERRGDDSGAARLAHWGTRLAPWHARGLHLLVVPPSAAICRLFGLGDWEAQTLARLKGCTRRPVVVSYKGDPKPLSTRLDGCQAVITWTSNVAVDAIVAGVPAFVSPHSAARPVAGALEQLEDTLETPPRPAREAWAGSLAWGQFTLDEIARGDADGWLEEQRGASA